MVQMFLNMLTFNLVVKSGLTFLCVQIPVEKYTEYRVK